MGTHNGYVIDLELRDLGDGEWGGHTDWSTWYSWTEHTDTTLLALTGAKGSALRYRTDIIDLGASKYVYPEITCRALGSPRIVIEYGDASDLSDATFLGKYTDDNDQTASSVFQTHHIIDYINAGYTDDDYQGFKARYVRITVFVERFIWSPPNPIPLIWDPDRTSPFFQYGRTNPRIFNLNIAFKNDMQTEEQYDVAVNADPYTITTTDIDTIVSMNITAHSETDKKLVPQIIDKDNKTIRVIDANKFDTTGVNATVDIAMTGLPAVQANEDGSIGRQS